METAKRNRLMIVWAFRSMALVAIFWLVWYLAVGSIPTVEKVAWWKQAKATTYWNLPVPFSRAWDLFGIIPFIPLLIALLARAKRDDVIWGLVVGLVVGLVGVLVVGLLGGLLGGLFGGLLWGLFGGRIGGLGVGLGTGLALGFIWGFPLGLAATLALWSPFLAFLLVKTAVTSTFHFFKEALKEEVKETVGA